MQISKEAKFEPENNQNQSLESITALLNSLFPEQQQYDKEIKQIKEALGELASRFTVDELHVMVSEIQYLTGSWLDSFEKEMFEGKTLQELLNDG